MMKPALITTPIPTLDEVAKSLGIGKARKNSIIRIMTGGAGLKQSTSGRLKVSTSSKVANLSKGRSKKSGKRVSKRP